MGWTNLTCCIYAGPRGSVVASCCDHADKSDETNGDGASGEKCESVTTPREPTSRNSLPSDDGQIPKDDPADYPEGGLRAWLVTFGAFCGMFAGFGVLNTIGIFQAYLSTHQLKRYDDSTNAWIFSIYAFVLFFCGLQIGPVFDAKGPRLLILMGSFCLIVGMMLLGLCTGR